MHLRAPGDDVGRLESYAEAADLVGVFELRRVSHPGDAFDVRPIEGSAVVFEDDRIRAQPKARRCRARILCILQQFEDEVRRIGILFDGRVPDAAVEAIDAIGLDPSPSHAAKFGEEACEILGHVRPPRE
ncbi:hypothetical protein [Bradyrhizobium sp. S3.12.5]|uniref:hypothetical protein n=1 Tax=Bradyrhizobium sp. S3.12.5 TaxID=3156386 RepID=UPI003394D997